VLHRPRSRRLLAGAAAGLVAAAAAASLPTGSASGQETHVGRLAALGAQLEKTLPPTYRSALSGGGLRLLEVGERLDRFDLRGLSGPTAAGATAGAGRDAAPVAPPGWPAASPAVQVSDPYSAEDFASRLAGMTQNETSAAWCGPTVAIGWNDSGSLVATAFLGASPTGSFSFLGWARSGDAGRSYVDGGALLPRTLPAGVQHRDLLGDPVLGCTSAKNFYYASLAVDVFPGGDAASGIAVSRSTDGAVSFPRTTVAVRRALKAGQLLDKPWMVVAPGRDPGPDDDVVHVAYTNFDMSGTSARCGPDQPRAAIEYVRSTDGARSWAPAVALAEVCGTEQLAHGSQVAVGPGGEVYAAWQEFRSFPSDSTIRIRRSGDRGTSWAPARTVDRVTSIGTGFGVQGNFRTFLALQGLAVDRSPTATRGAVYLTWHDGRFHRQPDPLGGCDGPAYCFGDALVARSLDRGATWSGAVRVNDDTARRGVDQIFPALDVDRDGTVWVGFYDRRRDARNFLLDMFVASSTDAGRTWANRRASPSSFAPVLGGQDLLVNPLYMGDYQAVAADRLGSQPGAITAWGDNSRGDADVVARTFIR
jgi:hypothetical protein